MATEKSHDSRKRSPAQRPRDHDEIAPVAENRRPLHPALRLQHQVGNAQVARLMAQRDESLALPEVGMAGGTISNQLMARIQVQRGRGAPLSRARREQMEEAFETPLGDVRLYTDATADALNRSLSAKAFTIGSDIFFRQDANPNDAHLLTHELAHVVQQRGMSDSGPMTVGPAGDSFERAADQIAKEVAAGSRQINQAPSSGGENGAAAIQRDWWDDVVDTADIMSNPIAGGALSFLGAASEGATGALGAAGAMAGGAGAVLGPLGILSGGAGIYDAVTRPGTFGLDDLTDTVLGGAGVVGGTAGTIGGLAALTGAGAGTTLGGAAALANPVGAVIGAGVAGYGAGRLLDEGVGALGQAITGDTEGDYTISGGLAGGMTAADQALTSLWADPDEPAYTQTIGWQLAEMLPSWLQ